MILEVEEWLDIKGYEGYYQISNHGRIRSLDRTVSCNKGITYLKGKLLKLQKDRQGYLRIGLSKNNYKCMYLVSRLVALHFIENPFNFPEVNHLESKDNNYFKALEWTTSLENQNHRQKNKTTSSKFNGVSWNKEKSKWVSRICVNRKNKHLGFYDTEEEAHSALIKYEKENNILNRYR